MSQWTKTPLIRKYPQPRVIDRQFVQSVAEAQGQIVASVSFGQHRALSVDYDRRSLSKASSFSDSKPLVERDMVRPASLATRHPVAILHIRTLAHRLTLTLL